MKEKQENLHNDGLKKKYEEKYEMKKLFKKNVSEETAITWLWLSVFIILVDQVTKYLANKYLILSQPVKLLPFLNFTLQYNTGAAFSFLGAESGWQVYLLAAISLIVSVIVFLWLVRMKYPHWLMAFSLSLILGGALGNFIDRCRYGFVVDFIDFHIGQWHFATFNVADSAISIGAVLLIGKLLFYPDKKMSIHRN